MIEIETPEIRIGKNESGEYAEIVIPEEFNPGSVMVFATDMDVSLSLLQPLLVSPFRRGEIRNDHDPNTSTTICPADDFPPPP